MASRRLLSCLECKADIHLCCQILGDEVAEAPGEQQTAGAFQPAPRVTEADHRKDTKSLQRALDKRLFLLVKRQGIYTFKQPCNSSQRQVRCICSHQKAGC